jgi:hypothetical protein
LAPKLYTAVGLASTIAGVYVTRTGGMIFGDMTHMMSTNARATAVTTTVITRGEATIVVVIVDSGPMADPVPILMNAQNGRITVINTPTVTTVRLDLFAPAEVDIVLGTAEQQTSTRMLASILMNVAAQVSTRVMLMPIVQTNRCTIIIKSMNVLVTRDFTVMVILALIITNVLMGRNDAILWPLAPTHTATITALVLLGIPIDMEMAASVMMSTNVQIILVAITQYAQILLVLITVTAMRDIRVKATTVPFATKSLPGQIQAMKITKWKPSVLASLVGEEMAIFAKISLNAMRAKKMTAMKTLTVLTQLVLIFVHVMLDIMDLEKSVLHVTQKLILTRWSLNVTQNRSVSQFHTAPSTMKRSQTLASWEVAKTAQWKTPV